MKKQIIILSTILVSGLLSVPAQVFARDGKPDVVREAERREAHRQNTQWTPENHEEFARQYLPESQAIFERFRKDCGETKVLRENLGKDLLVMNRDPLFDVRCCALDHKIAVLSLLEAKWAKFVKDCYFKHKGNLVGAEALAEKDAVLSQKMLVWEKTRLIPLLRNKVENFGVPEIVAIPGKGFSIGKYEVTQAEYESVMGRNPSGHKGADLPVENVSWHDAMDFCKKLTERERMLGLMPAGYKYTLPTSAQWEYACRAGTTTKFYTGDTKQDLARAGWYGGNSGNQTHPVGQKEPNAFGLYDMHGNVWEWCLDEEGEGSKRVNRGGSFFNDLDFICSSSHVDSDDPDLRLSRMGFRVALVPVVQRCREKQEM